MISNASYSISTFLTFFLIFTSAHAGEPNNHPEIKVTYIANAGFLVTSNSQKILIDAIFYNPKITYCDIPSEELLYKMERAESPFHDVNLLLVTHKHADHFSAVSVSKHLQNNKKCKLVCPHQVVRKMMDECPYFDSIKHQIIDITIESHVTRDTTVNDIRLQALRLPHVPFYTQDEKTGEEYDMHKDIENLAYLINTGSRRILHVGDALLFMNEEYFKTLNVNIDLVFIGRYDITDESLQILSAHLKPTHIIYMHLPVSDRQRIIDSIKMKAPGAVVFERSLEERRFQ